jgi:hypothetical protein
MTQGILASMKSDEVNSISDTIEAQTVAGMIKDSYYDMISELNIPEHYSLIELDATTTTTPLVMTVPDTVYEIAWIKYNIQDTGENINYSLMDYKPLDTFLMESNSLSETDSSVSTMVYTTDTFDHTIKYRNDLFPSCYSLLDESTVIFNSVKTTIDNPLVSTKTQCYASTSPPFTLTDSFVPDLDARQFSYLYDKAKAQVFIELKQTQNPVAEARSRRQKIASQKYKDAFHEAVPDYHKYTPNMGRKR